MKVGVFRTRRKRIGNAGFSLLEVMVAVVILALVAAPILQTFLTTAKINGNAKKTLEATNLAQTIMEDLTSQTFDNNLKNTFTTASATNVLIIKALSYSCPVEDKTSATIDGFDKFVTAMSSAYGTSDSKYVYFAKWIASGVDCFAASIHNVKYENAYFDVVFALTPSEGYTAGDKFYTYDVEMKVFMVKEGKHYENELVTIQGAVANKN